MNNWPKCFGLLGSWFPVLQLQQEGFDAGPGMVPGMGPGTPVPWGPGMPGYPTGMPAFPNGMAGYPGGMQVPSWAGPGKVPNILPHPSMRGVTKSSLKKKNKTPNANAKQPETDPSKPNFTPDTKAMFLCRVALGRLAVGHPGMRLPPKGADAVS